MKVTIIGTLPPIIGLSPYCLHLSDALTKKIDLEFLGFKKFSNQSKLFIRESKIDENFYSNILNRIKTKNMLNWYNPFSGVKAGINLKTDILHVQWWISSLIFVYLPIIIAAKIKKIKIIITVHNIYPHEKKKINLLFDRISNKLIFTFADSFIVHNKRNKEKLSELYNINQTKISIISHGAFNLTKKEIISLKEARKYLHLPLNKKIVLFFGYIRKYKGVDVLIKSFGLVQRKMKDVFLLIVGQPFEEKWEKYEELIKENNLTNKSRIELGFVPESELKYYFSATDIVVLPYTYLDTHGGIGALALPFKKPLMVSDVGGLPEYIKDKNALVEPNNVIDLSNKLINILQDEKLLEKLSKDSEEYSKKLNWDGIADKTVEVYKNLI